MAATYEPAKGFLNDLYVIEIGQERGEFAGKVLASLGANVIRVEPPGGSPTRNFGPFYEDRPDPEGSLYFWHYNLGKRSAVIDITTTEGVDQFKQLIAGADVLVESFDAGYMASIGLDYERLSAINPRLIMVSMTPFGQTGPWRDYKASDLIHLALGGEMNYTRYAPSGDGTQDTPPIAGQMWQSYTIAGDHAVMAVYASLINRMQTGKGQYVDLSIHQVCAVTTEIDVPTWIYNKVPFASIRMSYAPTRDGRYVLAMPPSPGLGAGLPSLVEMLKQHNQQRDLEASEYQDPAHNTQPQVAAHIVDIVRAFAYSMTMEKSWHAAQKVGLLWAAIRKPEENLSDANWRARSTFGQVEHPEIGKTFDYPTGRWHTEDVPWKVGPRAPRIGEHTTEVLREAAAGQKSVEGPIVQGAPAPKYRNRTNRRFPLEGVRVLDLTWLLASAGGPKIFSSLGAECIRVEWRDRLDILRRAQGVVPDPGQPVGTPPKGVNRGGYFNDINAGRMGISLNMNTPRGKELFTDLLKMSDIVVEGFSARLMERWGFGYEEMRKIKPDIIYVQQSGFGKKGEYSNYRSVGPVAQAISGITDLSGLPEPFPPVGWLYSWLDFGGAYNCTLAMLSGLYYKRRTGKGIYIDSSQLEPGIYYTGTAIIDHQANGRKYSRSGNRSPYTGAAPHGAYRCAGPASPGDNGDRWIAIACFREEEWTALCGAMSNPAWTREPKFATREARYLNQDALDACVTEWTQGFDAWELMERLQQAGVPAGVCQTAAERVESDPQLKHLGWLTDLPHSEIGTYPIKGFPVRMSETPAYQGGPIDRAAPCYGEDNAYVYGELLGLSATEIAGLKTENII